MIRGNRGGFEEAISPNGTGDESPSTGRGHPFAEYGTDARLVLDPALSASNKARNPVRRVQSRPFIISFSSSLRVSRPAMNEAGFLADRDRQAEADTHGVCAPACYLVNSHLPESVGAK